ncbi:hypothetical protein PLICRDRAFT_47197 [Plicaturopsis crispa FD-325 SS-3]|uniref:SH3 domain-containing protein n=1 Tax=Plicaturopsis crispa FD-325 SS-3 TaxID=944288 RepID=A0A0C9T5F4_PLICR|nr:hypothetical protein PLICRDRAFT_47197 [Plicaturopsis crispa FD-325 SS-3]
MPGAHEFAVKPPPAGRKKSLQPQSQSQPQPQRSEEKGEDVTPPATNGATHADNDPSPVQETPTLRTDFERQTTPTVATIALPDLTDTASPPPISKPLRDSLTSTRPAPPSPAPSRAPSRRVSTAPSTASSHRHTHSHTPSQPRIRPVIHIRDFGFPASDEKHLGLGPLVPRQNRHNRHRHGSSSSSSSSTASEDLDGVDGEEGDDDGWGGFKWGFGRLSSWGFGRGSSGGGGGGANGYTPSENDFARNFDSPLDDDDDALDGDDGPVDLTPDADEPAPEPGIYRALYAFEPEGVAEMSLTEEQMVKVIGRGGIGWVIALRDDGSHALVPESYLELVRSNRDLDDDSDDE